MVGAVLCLHTHKSRRTKRQTHREAGTQSYGPPGGGRVAEVEDCRDALCASCGPIRGMPRSVERGASASEERAFASPVELLVPQAEGMSHDHFTVQASGGGGDDDPVPAWEAGGRTTPMATAALLAALIASLVLLAFFAEPSEARIFGPPRNAAYPGTGVADNVIVWSAPNGGQRVGGCYNSRKWGHVPRKAARAWNAARATVGNPNVPRFVRASLFARRWRPSGRWSHSTLPPA